MADLARLYNKPGATGVSDQRTKPLPSPPPTLNAEQARALEAALRGPAPGGGLLPPPRHRSAAAEEEQADFKKRLAKLSPK